MELNNSSKQSPENNLEKLANPGRYLEVIQKQGKAINLFKRNLEMSGLPRPTINQITENILRKLHARSANLDLLTPEDKAFIFNRAAIEVLGENEFDLAMERLHIIKQNKQKLEPYL